MKLITTWAEFENIMINVKKQGTKAFQYDLTYVLNIKNELSKTLEMNAETVLKIPCFTGKSVRYVWHVGHERLRL